MESQSSSSFEPHTLPGSRIQMDERDGMITVAVPPLRVLQGAWRIGLSLLGATVCGGFVVFVAVTIKWREVHNYFNLLPVLFFVIGWIGSLLSIVHAIARCRRPTIISYSRESLLIVTPGLFRPRTRHWPGESITRFESVEFTDKHGNIQFGRLKIHRRQGIAIRLLTAKDYFELEKLAGALEACRARVFGAHP